MPESQASHGCLLSLSANALTSIMLVSCLSSGGLEIVETLLNNSTRANHHLVDRTQSRRRPLL